MTDDTTTDSTTVKLPTPDYAVEAAADLLEPLRRYYNEMEERPSFSEFALRVADWFHTWMDDAHESDEPLWKDAA